jgi:hypothetical protein
MSRFAAILILFSVHLAQAYSASVESLKQTQERSRQNLTTIDHELELAYSSTTKLGPQDVGSGTSIEQTLNQAKEKIDQLLDQKREESLRIELIDKVIFKIAEKNNKSIRENLPKALDEIALNEMAIGARSTNTDKAIVFFIMNLATALRTLPEPIENPLGFMDNYIQYSSILNPKPVSEFRMSQGYLNSTGLETSTRESKSE